MGSAKFTISVCVDLVKSICATLHDSSRSVCFRVSHSVYRQGSANSFFFVRSGIGSGFLEAVCTLNDVIFILYISFV